MTEKVYAGLDVDGIAKLFIINKQGKVRNVTHLN
jgi:hypothetical protein